MQYPCGLGACDLSFRLPWSRHGVVTKGGYQEWLQHRAQAQEYASNQRQNYADHITSSLCPRGKPASLQPFPIEARSSVQPAVRMRLRSAPDSDCPAP